MCDFTVKSVRSYKAMRAMSTALPNLQRLSICNLNSGHKYTDGDGDDPDDGENSYSYDEDPCEDNSFDVNIISRFSKLSKLCIHPMTHSKCSCPRNVPLNGRYPVLFNFHLLQQLKIKGCYHLKWDLGMLSGLPLLKELHCCGNSREGVPNLTGNLRSLRVLQNTLEVVVLPVCRTICGNFIDLADFPRLKKLYLEGTYITGDVQDVCEDDFPALKDIFLPQTVIGCQEYEFQYISDVPTFMQAIYPVLQSRPKIFRDTQWRLSRDSPDYYYCIGRLDTPFHLWFCRAGPHLGWSWGSEYFSESHFCEVNWLDPEDWRSDSRKTKFVHTTDTGECQKNML